MSKVSASDRTKLIAFIAVTLLLSGCTTIPPSIKGNGQPDLQKDFLKIQKTPSLYVGQQARLGGLVINVINQPNETLLEIAVLPLNINARPEISAQYQGRLLAKSLTFLDPVNFRNHYVTLLGNLTGSRSGRVGNSAYPFITMNVSGYQVWQEETQIMPAPGFDYGIGPVWPADWNGMMYPGWGWYDPPLQVEKTLYP
ncbi:hypothetical protein C3432_12075 [Citrobacter amalonaticus]|uniref:Slp family lipoprotein n=1 Tax=Citrobacter amalonaticus TaxID=35703 RepID=A0A2S4RRH3_CITAM|nr:Slp family lipoprotein [Citrobacter amalonaticus]POT58613.1 hypothetical protein C3432_12075 [Citrobacter amalonaticus]POT70351.1 hypothetical protein C3436_24775 [Citrobacter amalonaticus]POU61335.1 hypothetical protein C3430_23685 [Citrobacter amalonaticus]POV05096.1 hypothetical protein C3424_07045 [Citrobacter amalonaticus]